LARALPSVTDLRLGDGKAARLHGAGQALAQRTVVFHQEQGLVFDCHEGAL